MKLLIVSLFSLLGCFFQGLQAQNIELSYLMNSEWSQWSPWSFCSGSVRVRVRACSTVRGFKCTGHNKEFESCEDHPVQAGGIDYDAFDPWHEDRKIAMGQLYEDYDSGVPDVRPNNMEAKRRRVRPPRPTTREGPIPKKNILDAMDGGHHRAVVNLEEERVTEQMRRVTQTTVTTTEKTTTTTSTTTTTTTTTSTTTTTTEEPTTPTTTPTQLTFDPFTDFMRPDLLNTNLEDLAPMESLRVNTASIHRGSAIPFSPPTEGRKVPVASIPLPTANEEMHHLTRIQQEVLPSANQLYGLPAPSHTLSQHPYQRKHRHSKNPVPTLVDLVQNSLTKPERRMHPRKRINGERRQELTEEKKEVLDTELNLDELDRKLAVLGGRVREEDNRQIARLPQPDKASHLSSSRGVVVVAPRNPSNRPQSLRIPLRAPTFSATASNNGKTEFGRLAHTPTSRVENQRLAVISEAPQEESKFRIAELNGQFEQQRPKIRTTHHHVDHLLHQLGNKHSSHGHSHNHHDRMKTLPSLPVSDVTARKINTTMDKIGRIIEDLERDAKELKEKSSESDETVDLSQMSEEERKIYTETRELERKIKQIQDKMEHNTHQLKNHAEESVTEKGILEGDTARALSWMIANMTKEMGESGDLPVVDIIPLQSVSTVVPDDINESGASAVSDKPKVVTNKRIDSQTHSKNTKKGENSKSSNEQSVEVVEPIERHLKIVNVEFDDVPFRSRARMHGINQYTIEKAIEFPGMMDNQMNDEKVQRLNDADIKVLSKILPKSDFEKKSKKTKQPDWVWSPWSEWSECNCNIQRRKRVCIPKRHSVQEELSELRNPRNPRILDGSPPPPPNCPLPEHEEIECDSPACRVFI